MKNTLQLSTLATAVSTLAVSLSAHAADVSPPAAVTTSVAGTTQVGKQTSGMNTLWSDWYAQQGVPLYSVNGGLLVKGDWTTAAALPSKGTAEYAGSVSGREVSSSTNLAVTGKVKLTADFSRRILAGSFTDLSRSDGRGVGGGASKSVSFGAGFANSTNVSKNTSAPDRAWGQLSANGMTGELQARFNNGINGVAGVWYLSGSNVTTGLTVVSGTFAASVQAPATAAPAPAPAPAPTPGREPAPTPAPAPAPVVKPAPVPVASGEFNSWAGTAKPGVLMAAKTLTPEGYSASDAKQAKYAGTVQATAINLRDNGKAAVVQGEIALAVNLDARTVKGEIGNFKGATDAGNFLNTGTIKVSAEINRSTMNTFSGSAVWTPGTARATTATGSFTGNTDTKVSSGSSGWVYAPGNLAQGSWSLGSADFKLDGSWKATQVPKPGR